MFNHRYEPSKLFENSLPITWKKVPTCVNCANEFSVNLRNVSQLQPQRPHLLECTHNICDRCAFAIRSEAIKCKECDYITHVDRNVVLRQTLELNYFLFGSLNYIQFTLPNDLKFVSKSFDKPVSRAKYECSECNEEYTNHVCLQCGVPYCKTCFIRIHKFGKTLQKHTLSMFQSQEFSPNEKRKRCSTHKKNYVLYCVKCNDTLCSDCAATEHNGHKIITISSKNDNSSMKIPSLVGTLKMAQEYTTQALKDIKYVEKKREDYAKETIETVSKFFLMLHGHLQILEKQILLQIKNSMMKMLGETEALRGTLNKSLEAYSEMSSMLTDLQTNLPENFLLDDIMDHINTKLEKTPCNVDFRGIDGNPFSVSKLNDPQSMLKNLITVECNLANFHAKLSTFFDGSSMSTGTLSPDKNLSVEDIPSQIFSSLTCGSETRDNIPLNTKTQKSKNKDKDTKKKYEKKPAIPKPQKLMNSQKVHVSHIKSPQCFYVQNQSFLSAAAEFQEACAEEAGYAASPAYIELNQMYLVLNSIDHKWYRGIVMAKTPTNVFKVFLLDYGESVEIPKQRFREMPEDIENRPPGAIMCSLYGIKPKVDTWNDSANHLMSEIILNQMVSMFIISEDNPTLVDLMTIHHKYPVSVRDALIFTDMALAEEIRDEKIQQRIHFVKEIKRKSNIASSKKFYRNIFKSGESFRVVVLHIINPEEFYAAKYDHKQEIEAIQEKLNDEYQKVREKIYLPQSGMICAASINQTWHRVRIEHVSPKVECKVKLVDNGTYETVNWKQLRILDEKYISPNEAVIQCCLTDIAPLQKNGYAWTKDAISEFQRITMNPFIQIFIHSMKDNTYKVSLYVIQKNVDVNVNALLVKYKHAISTGNESTCVEYPKKQTLEKITAMSYAEEFARHDVSAAQKYGVKVKMANIVSPGEFYVKLVKHIPGISKLHQHIQENPQKRTANSETDKKSWQKRDKCLVRADLRQDEIYQWYRALITDVKVSESDSEFEYTVYLRDQGTFLTGIKSHYLAPLDSTFDRVTDGAIKCHLACVQPTGGMNIWSASSIDEFRVLVCQFEGLGASIQGNRKADSIPVILWGMSSECKDPLSPVTCKWVNINKSLVNCGLVHLIEKFRPKMINADDIESEMANGKESFTDWVSEFVEKIEKKLNVDDLVKDEEVHEFSEFEDDEQDSEAICEWLPARPIEKTIFTCIPTYVDSNCIIYLHDTAQKRLLDNIKVLINQKDLDSEANLNEVHWYVGQPCLARYHLDRAFYRAVIVHNKCNKKVSVRFVDYGNVEECSISDLRKTIMLGKIPIQSNKFQLDKIKPKGGSGIWQRDTLDFIHAQIVGKTCSIRVSDNQENEDIKKCSLIVDAFDIADLLLSMHMVERVQSDPFPPPYRTTSPKYEYVTPNNEKEIAIYDEKCSEKDAETNPEKSPEPTLENIDHDDYRKIFEKMEFDILYKEVVTENDDNFDIEFDESEHSVALFSQDTNSEYKILEETCDSAAFFEPEDTSTTSEFCELELFKPLTLPEHIQGFYCETTTIVDSTNVYVSPYLSDYEKQFKEMAKRIQNLAKACKNMEKFEAPTPCLAKYESDGLWYRAIIREYFSENNNVEVLYVDYLNTEIVKTSLVKECPKYLLDFPLRNIKLKLHNVRRNFRWRSSDVRRELGKILNKKRIFAKIINEEEVTAELYDSHREKILLYDDLIMKKFFIKIKQ